MQKRLLRAHTKARKAWNKATWQLVLLPHHDSAQCKHVVHPRFPQLIASTSHTNHLTCPHCCTCLRFASAHSRAHLVETLMWLNIENHHRSWSLAEREAAGPFSLESAVQKGGFLRRVFAGARGAGKVRTFGTVQHEVGAVPHGEPEASDGALLREMWISFWIRSARQRLGGAFWSSRTRSIVTSSRAS